MAKKKSSKKKANAVKEFSSSPFKSLKGLSAFEKEEPQATCDNAQFKMSEDKVSPDSSSAQVSFAEEMNFLGVKPLPESVVEESECLEDTEINIPEKPRLTREESEKEVFLDAVGSVEKVFKDEWPIEEPAKQAVPRRMKQVERGTLKPEAKLDLHGMTIAEASDKVRFFLQDAHYHGFKTVLVITGKGLHSSDGPVLRQAVEKMLSQHHEQVIEWGVAPRRYGGDGALILFLR